MIKNNKNNFLIGKSKNIKIIKIFRDFKHVNILLICVIISYIFSNPLIKKIVKDLSIYVIYKKELGSIVNNFEIVRNDS